MQEVACATRKRAEDRRKGMGGLCERVVGMLHESGHVWQCM